jgi:hypothetical protein
VLRDPEYLAIVLANEFIVRRDVTLADPVYQGHIRMLLVFACYWLDGRHWGWLREICCRGGYIPDSLRLSVMDGIAEANSQSGNRLGPPEPFASSQLKPFPTERNGTGSSLFPKPFPAYH